MLFIKTKAQKVAGLTKLATYARSSQAPVRNFFELNPIYPDRNDYKFNLEKDHAKLPFFRSDEKLEKIERNQRKKFMANIYAQRTRERIRDRESGVKKAGDSSFKNMCKRLSENLYFDETLNAPFGMGFDEYLWKTKEQRLKAGEAQFLNSVQKILNVLSLKNEQELVRLYEHVISAEQVSDYRDAARNYILERILRELVAFKKARKPPTEILEKYLDPANSNIEYIISNFQDIEGPEAMEKLSAAIRAEEIDKVARGFSRENLREKIQKQEDADMKPMSLEAKIKEHANLKNDDPFFSSEPPSSEEQRYILENSGENPMSRRVQILSDEKFSEYQIFREVRKSYFKNKRKFIEMETQSLEDPYSLIVINKAEEKLSKAAKNLDIKEFLSAPAFQEVFESVDSLITNAPNSLKNRIEKDMKEKNLRFDPSLLGKNVSVEDLLWSRLSDRFESVFPIDYNPGPKVEERPKGKEAAENKEGQSKLSFKEELYSQGMEYDTTLHESPDVFNFAEIMADQDAAKFSTKNEFGEKNLPQDLRTEIQVFRKIRKDPFFRHHLINELRYFAERNEDQYLQIRKGKIPYVERDDLANYVNPSPNELDFNTKLQEKASRISKKYEENDKVYCSGKRKTCSALAVIYRGWGRVTVNKKPFLTYFPNPIWRKEILVPIEMINAACEYNIDLHIRGGGVNAQAWASAQAIARCLVKRNPLYKPLFKKFAMLTTDPRQVERKKVGLYKARAKYPYRRR